MVETGGGKIEPVDNLFCVSRTRDAFGKERHCLGRTADRGRKATVFTAVGGHFTQFFLQRILKGHEGFAQDADCLGEGFCTHGHDAKFLNVQIISRMHAAVDQAGLGNGKYMAPIIEILV